MYAFTRNYFLIILFFTSSILVNAQTVIFQERSREINVRKNLSIFEDKSGKIPFEQIQKQIFQPNLQLVPNWGSSNSVFWLKLSIINQSTEPTFLEIRNAIIDKIDFYLLDNKRVMLNHSQAGKFYVNQSKDLHTNFFTQRIPKNDLPQTIFIRIESSLPLQIPVFVATEQTL